MIIGRYTSVNKMFFGLLGQRLDKLLFFQFLVDIIGPETILIIVKINRQVRHALLPSFLQLRGLDEAELFLLHS